MMKNIVILAVLSFFVLVACGGSDKNNNTPAAKKEKKKKPVDGAKVYKQYCVTCHGMDGDMGASGAVDLTTSTLSKEEAIKVITDGRNTMTPFKGLLSEAKIEAVAQHIQTLKK